MIRIGLVGCGHIGTVHAYVIQQLAEAGVVDAALVATYDADPKRAARVARHHGGDPVASVDELAAAVDAVWVCTWTGAHLEAVEVAVAADRPVFCEKPLGPDLAAAQRVAGLLGRVPHQVGLVLRWSPVFERAAEIIASGEYGRPLATAFRDDQYFPIQGMYGSTWRKDVEHAGGGTLIEHSIHDVDVLHWLLGEPVSVSARTASHFGYPGIEDTAAVTFVYDDASVAQLTSVWHQVLTRESGRYLEVFCERAALWTDDDYLGPLHVQTSDSTHEITAPLPEWAGRLTVPEVYAHSIAHYGSAAKAFLDRLSARAAGRAAGPGHPSAAEALAAHRLVDRAYRSAASGGAPIPAAADTPTG
jgi:myo-inositol 2-dehydrogenase / D-chiro-inositol 1-dehydrogenase